MGTDCGKDYLQPYREAVARHGPSFHATLWASPEGQQIRFDVMIDLAGFAGCAVLDVGCGRGDFARRLLDREIAFERFIGVDALPDLVTSANSRNMPRCEFHMADALTDLSALGRWSADYICFSGTLNTMTETDARRVVQAAFDAAAQGVVFKFLSNRYHERWQAHDLGPASRFDTLKWIEWALEQTSRVTFTQDYLDGHDATMLMRHD
jgi:SAM-dependent methyltransferase